MQILVQKRCDKRGEVTDTVKSKIKGGGAITLFVLDKLQIQVEEFSFARFLNNEERDRLAINVALSDCEEGEERANNY